MAVGPYDLKLTIDPDGTPTEIGLMLVKPEDQPKQYIIGEVEVPGQHLDWVQDDFRGGMLGTKAQPSGTNQYGVAQNMIANPQTGHLFSGPDFEVATTVGSAALTVFGGIVHNLADGTHVAFLINNNDVWKSNTAGTSFASALNPGAVVPLSVASWGDYVLVTIQGDDYHYSIDDGGSFTERNTAAGSSPEYFIPAGDVLWGIANPDSLRWTVDPTNSGTWSGETLVGEDTNDIWVGGFFIAQMLILIKTSGIYVVDDGGNVEQVVTVRNIRGACTDMISKIYFYDVQDNVWEYDIFQGLLRNLNLSTSVYLNPVIGGNIFDPKALRPGGIAYADGKVFVSPSKVIYQWSQFRDSRGNLVSETWECLYGNTSLAATWGILFAAHELLVGTNVSFPLYFGGSANATEIGYVRARTVGDFNDTSNLTYTIVDSWVYSAYIDHDHPTTRKMYQYVEVDLGGNDLNARISYAVDGGQFANLGAAAITTTGKTIVEFPAGTEGYRVMLKLTNDPTDNADYIELKSWSVHATLQPHYRRLVKVAARIADGIILRNSARHHQRGDTLRTNLQDARTTAARLQLQDYFGNDFNIVILSPLVEVPSRDEKASDTESEIQFAAVEYGVETAT